MGNPAGVKLRKHPYHTSLSLSYSLPLSFLIRGIFSKVPRVRNRKNGIDTTAALTQEGKKDNFL